MTTSIRVTKNFRDLSSIPPPGTPFWRQLGEGLLTRIRKRTARGVDAKGRAFKPLSRAYAERKQDALGTRAADLTVSGRMLNEMTVKPQPKRVSLGFVSGGSTRASGGTFIQRSRSVSAADKAFWHNDVGAGRAKVKRQFFDLSQSDVSWAHRLLGDHIDKSFRR